MKYYIIKEKLTLTGQEEALTGEYPYVAVMNWEDFMGCMAAFGFEEDVDDLKNIHGMNFVNMPELNAEWGYPGIIVLSVLIIVIEVIIFKKKKWL